MGYKAPYFSQVIKGTAALGDGFIDRMCSAFGLTFIPAGALSDNATTQRGTVTVDAKAFSDLLEQVKTQTRLLNAVLDRLEK